MDANGNQQREFAAFKNNALQAQHVNSQQNAIDPRMVDPAYLQSHTEPHYTNSQYCNVPLPPALINRTLHLWQQSPVNDNWNMQPQDRRLPRYNSDARVPRAANHQHLSAQAQAHLYHYNRNDVPHAIVSQTIKVPNRGVKRSLAETEPIESQPRYQSPPRRTSIYHISPTTYNQTIPACNPIGTPAVQTSHPQNQFHQLQQTCVMRPPNLNHTHQVQPTQTMPFYCYNQARPQLQQPQTLNPTDYPPQYILGYRNTDGIQHQQHFQQVTINPTIIGNVECQGLPQQHPASPSSVDNTQNQKPSQQIASQHRTSIRLWLECNSQVRDWAKQHRQELWVFMKFLHECRQASSLSLPTDSPQQRAEIMVVVGLANLRQLPMSYEEIGNAREEPMVKRLAQQLLVFYEQRARTQELPLEIVAICTLMVCAQRGIPFTFSSEPSLAQLPFQSLQHQGQHQSRQSSDKVEIDLTNDDILPTQRPSALGQTQNTSDAAAAAHTGVAKVPSPDGPRPVESVQTDRGDVEQDILPTEALPDIDEASERLLLQPIVEWLNETAASALQPEEAPTQPLPGVVASISPIVPAAKTSSPSPQVHSNHSTPPLTLGSDFAHAESSSPSTPPALRAADWCRPEHISSDYTITPESAVQARMYAALARQAANGDAAAAVAGDPGAMEAHPTWTALPPGVAGLGQSEQAYFIPPSDMELPMPAGPLGKQELMFWDLRNGAREAEINEGSGGR